jgi:metal-responsive CopG/Arc/MetJ family transcriptional regulator
VNKEVIRMRKTMVYLEDDQFLLLKGTAASSKKRMSEIIREALSSYLREKKKEKHDYFSFVGIAEGPKKGKTSEQAEEILREALK